MKLCETNSPMVALQPLFEGNNPNFTAINAKLPATVIDLLSPEELERVRKQLIDNVLSIIRLGHWNDLAGARELMQKIGITTLEFPVEFHQLITMLSERIPHQHQWVSIANSQTGPLHPSEPGYTTEEEAKETKRQKLFRCLRAMGFRDEELSDELIEKILLLRELMIVLVGMKTRPREVISLLRILELSE